MLKSSLSATLSICVRKVNSSSGTCILKCKYIIQFTVKTKHCNLMAPYELSNLSVCIRIGTFENNHGNYSLSLKTAKYQMPLALLIIRLKFPCHSENVFQSSFPSIEKISKPIYQGRY